MTTGVTPAELLERITQSYMDLLKPAISEGVKNMLHLQKHQHNVQAMGYSVFVFDFPTGKKWISKENGVVEGHRSFCVILTSTHR